MFPVHDRAPEARYPAQIEQNYAVARWIVKHGGAYGLDPSRMVLSADGPQRRRIPARRARAFAAGARERPRAPAPCAVPRGSPTPIPPACVRGLAERLSRNSRGIVRDR
ncbi:alpha/beta hydrolase [Streptomyces sp. 900105755]